MSNLKQALKDIENSREDIINRLVQFVTTDTLLFWSPKDELKAEQKNVWEPYLRWFGRKTGASLNPTESINVDDKNTSSLEKLKQYLLTLRTEELAALYFASTELNSVILGLYFALENIDIQKIITAAFLEEKFQAIRWGENLPAEEKYREIADRLSDLRHTFVQ